MAGTDLAGFEILEERIARAARLIEELRGGKKVLEAENKRLKEELESLYIKNEELVRELECLTAKADKTGNTEKTREEIARKIEDMLARLDELEV